MKEWIGKQMDRLTAEKTWTDWQTDSWSDKRVTEHLDKWNTERWLTGQISASIGGLEIQTNKDNNSS